ncbi:Arc family DNA-binding protein [Bradyrhizobium jicamae]|nr:Arc family DNA-binding protein [Bradyrhizobium jicamae]
MARKPTEFVQLKLRIRESLRRRLERRATKEDRSTNAEAVKRLEDSLDHEDRLDAFAKEGFRMEERHVQWREEKAREEEKAKADRLDARLFRNLTQSIPSLPVLIDLLPLLKGNPDWQKTEYGRRQMAAKVAEIILNADEYSIGGGNEG